MANQNTLEVLNRIAIALERIVELAEKEAATPPETPVWDDPDRVPDFMRRSDDHDTERNG